MGEDQDHLVSEAFYYRFRPGSLLCHFFAVSVERKKTIPSLPMWCDLYYQLSSANLLNAE
jgi:hypothetical protein